tara:strand:+ start:2121 stop:5324 length:3204 start_codon:yes stop_codon:yes gene_type:complete
MAEQTFKSPGFFEQELELTAERQEPQGVPAGIIGAAKMGPAFIPLTVGTFKDFENRFGSLSPEKFAPYAVKEWLENRQSVTFLRVLGAGANSTSTHFQNTRNYGFVNNAGFKVEPSAADKTLGSAQFLSAQHTISAASDVGFPLFTDNDEFSGTREPEGNTLGDDTPHRMIRAMLLNTSGSMFKGINNAIGVHNGAASSMTIDANDITVNADGDSNFFYLQLVLDGYTDSTHIDLSWGNDKTTAETESTGTANGQNVPNRIYKCSFDPDSQYYLGKVLNTDPKKFQDEGHLLWLDLGIENELAAVDAGAATAKLVRGIGSASSLGTAADYATAQGKTQWNELFGLFNGRYQAPKTTKFISQPYGTSEYNLFHFECISDGAVANNEYKISISNLRKSTDPNYKYGSFTVELRKFDDSDKVPQIVERYVDCNLDPSSENFVARKIGDKKAVFNFDASIPEERRLIVSGRYPNRSLHVRIVMDQAVYKKSIPADSLPFGFRGIPVLDVKNRLEDSEVSILPPLAHTYKITQGSVLKNTDSNYDAEFGYSGQSGSKERTDSRIYWGVKTTRIEDDKLISGGIYQSNLSSLPSALTKAYTKFMGIVGGSSDSGIFQSDADAFNNNKFTLAQVAFAKSDASGISKIAATKQSVALADLLNGSSPSLEMKDAVYIRNGVWNVSTYQINDPYDVDFKRWTLASLVHDSVASRFNKFSRYAKFTNLFYGGWDGLNILDEDIEDLNDKATSMDTGGKSADSISGGLGLKGTNDGTMSGKGLENNIINSYRQSIKIMTDDTAVKHNLLAIPGIREPKVTDYAASAVRDYQMAMYVMDIPSYDESGTRLFDGEGRPDVEKSSDSFENRTIDNNFCAAYFPDVFINDAVNNRAVMVPSSVAALGAIGYNDQKAYPWFAPAGFNRGALGFVSNVRTRLSVSDRDELYEKRINPIANFPDGGFVIFGQKTMQIQPSALDRVNVRRMLLEVKRQVAAVANLVLFEQHTPATRKRFESLVSPRLALIQAQAGIEQYRVICDETNNSQKDIDENRMNGRILLVPTRAVEFIAIDFIVDSSGVSFV